MPVELILHHYKLFLSVPDDWESRWVSSEHAKDLGKFILSAGKYFSDKEEDKGKTIQ